MIKRPTYEDDPEITVWLDDIYNSATLSRKRWMVIALVALSLAVAQVIALIAMTPLKRVELRVIQVEKGTGVTTVLKPLEQGEQKSYTENEAVTKSFISRYVLARETYDPQDLNLNYNTVRLMSSIEEGKRFDDSVSDTNPHSPIEKYKANITRTVHISSISFLNGTTAHVRFSTTENQKNEHREDYWVAILTYRYVNAPMNEEDRNINPLGFQIKTYRIDQEVVQ